MGAMPISERYDLIIGSDLLYEPDSAFFVAQYIDKVAMPKAEVWVVDPNRGYKNRFVRELKTHGFNAVDERLIERDDGYVLNGDRKSTRLNSSHVAISYAVFFLQKKQ